MTCNFVLLKIEQTCSRLFFAKIQLKMSKKMEEKLFDMNTGDYIAKGQKFPYMVCFGEKLPYMEIFWIFFVKMSQND